MTTKTPLHTFTNHETAMESYVYAADRGGYNITVRDLDAGEFLMVALYRADVDAAVTVARSSVFGPAK